MKQAIKTIILRAAFFCCVINCNAQELNYFDYHTGINNAELSIVKGDYQDALQQYDSLFSIYDAKFYTDVYNALLCAIILEKFDKAIELYKLVANSGEYSTNYFEKHSNFKKLFKTKEWKQINKQKSIHREISNPSDSVFWQIRANLNKKEQDESNDVLEFFKATYDNTITLYNLFNSEPDNLRLMFKGRIHEYAALMNHYYQLLYRTDNSYLYDEKFYREIDMTQYNLDSLYQIAVKKGYLRPEIYANAYNFKFDMNNSYNEMSVFVFRDSVDVFLFSNVNTDIEKTNMIRNKCGLPSISDNLIKALSTDVLLQNYPMKEFTKMLTRLERSKKFKQLDPIGQGEHFSNSFFELHEKTVYKHLNKKNKTHYSFIFPTIEITYYPSNPIVGDYKDDSFLKEMYESAKINQIQIHIKDIANY